MMNLTPPVDSKNRGRPRIDATLIGVRMPPDLLAALDRYIASSNTSMSRPEALRLAFKEWATTNGLIAQQPPDEGKRPDQLNSGNDG